MELTRGDYLLTDDKARLDAEAVRALLEPTYWAAGRSRETIARSIENSVCFGILRGNVLVGFGRVITDFATFNYLCDVIIAPEHRGVGLGKWMVDSILAHPALQSGPFYLRTFDAQELYRPFGFKDSVCMRRHTSRDVCLPTETSA